MRALLATLAATLALATASAHAQAPRWQAPRGQAPSGIAARRVSPIGARRFDTAMLRASQPAPSQPAPAPRPGRLACGADDNGVSAPASIELRASNRLVLSGSCGSAMEVPAGVYDATITLESALDRPTRTVRVIVPEGGLASARASFETAILEVRFTSARAPAHGIAFIERDGVAIGSLGSGVAARLSAGTYTVVARYRTTERRYTVTLAPAQRRALRAEF